VAHFDQFLGRAGTLDDFNDNTVNRFLEWYTTTKPNTARETLRGKRVSLCSLWRFAWELELLERLPRRVKKLRREQRMVEAWTLQEVDKLLTGIAKLRDKVKGKGVRRCDLFGAIALLGLNTGLRLGDLLASKWSDLQGDVLILIQSKTSNAVAHRLWPETIEALGKIKDHTGRLVGRIGKKCLQDQFHHLLRALGLPGSLKYMRRTAATLAELDKIGGATQLLGHRTANLAQRHYIDSRIGAMRPNQLPALSSMLPSMAALSSTTALVPAHSALPLVVAGDPANLPDLPVAIVQGATITRTVGVPDPRIAFCAQFNSLGVGQAVPLVAAVEGGAR